MTVSDLDILPNLRDLGGIALADGQLTRAGVLYRSALPIVGDCPPTTVAAWPVGTVVDLRSPKESTRTTHPLQSADTVVHLIPLMSDAEVAQPDQGARLADLYLQIVLRAGERLVEVLQVAATAAGPVLLHCAAGKDRTGIAVALLLRTAGVSPADIVADYLSTNDHMDAVLARLTRYVHGPKHNVPTARDLYGVAPEAIKGVLAMWDAHPGGVDGWSRSHGATEETIRLWKARITTRGNQDSAGSFANQPHSTY